MDLPSAMRPIRHSEELSLPKPPENLSFSDDNSDSDEDYRSKKGAVLFAIQLLKQVVPHLNSVY
jgi:hypothetical protein